MLPISFVYLHKALERLTSQTILQAKGEKEVIPESFISVLLSVRGEGTAILDPGG